MPSVKSGVCFSQPGSGLCARHRCCRRSARYITGVPRRPAQFLWVFTHWSPSGFEPGLDLGRMRRQPGVRLQVGTFGPSAPASTEQGPREAGQRITRASLTPKVHCRVHKNPPPNLSPATGIQSRFFHPVYLRFILMLRFF